VPLITVLALALLSAVLAYWTWTWFAPRPQPRAPAVAEAGTSFAAAAELFGRAQRRGDGPAPTGIAIKLLGVAAAAGKTRGYAIVELEPRNILAVRVGDEVAPGIRLAEVYPDRVILERSGTREMLAWPEPRARATQAVAPAPQARPGSD
jgi:general secretion pathway protein C